MAQAGCPLQRPNVLRIIYIMLTSSISIGRAAFTSVPPLSFKRPSSPEPDRRHVRHGPGFLVGAADGDHQVTHRHRGQLLSRSR